MDENSPFAYKDRGIHDPTPEGTRKQCECPLCGRLHHYLANKPRPAEPAPEATAPAVVKYDEEMVEAAARAIEECTKKPYTLVDLARAALAAALASRKDTIKPLPGELALIQTAMEALHKISDYTPASTVQPVAIARDALAKIATLTFETQPLASPPDNWRTMVELCARRIEQARAGVSAATLKVIADDVRALPSPPSPQEGK